MLILHQTGSIKVGEVVRYTLTYTPSADRILPAPSHLYVKIKNTSAIPLRAAYLHGPYTLHVSCYPSTYDPNKKHERHKEEGAPDFEPNVKAGAHWTSKLTVPEDVRQSASAKGDARNNERGEPKSFTWIIEIASQIIFSATASVHFELLVGRDERSLDLGFHGAIATGQGLPGKLEDHQQGRARNAAQPKGVFSKAARLAVDDTESLWNTPPFPSWDDAGYASTTDGPQHGDNRDAAAKDNEKTREQKKIHLVLLTHGLHSNLGADMLYLKESIDTAAKQAREDARKRRQELRERKLADQYQVRKEDGTAKTRSVPEPAIAPTATTAEEEAEDEEQVIVRGFSGNAVRTEKGIQYLGKRLAKYTLSITYPDQPYLPVKSSISKKITRSLTSRKLSDEHGHPLHKETSVVRDEEHLNHNLAYRITSISFISHSLGGLIQTYAVAYIQKHSPDFFDKIRPINFVAMSTPFLGLSNENPLYVKFALDFGLVGRTGQDLGLTWRPPTLAKRGWTAMVGGLGSETKKAALAQPDPGSKPLLRILPTGPAHVALKRFRNRSVYSNVVNDGIVPLRTSCLLFLDWRGLGRVEKARRENGLVGTMVGWGWAEMTGQNTTASPIRPFWNDLFGDGNDETLPVSHVRNTSYDHGMEVPQAEAGEGLDDNALSPRQTRILHAGSFESETYGREKSHPSPSQNLWTGLVSLFSTPSAAKAHHHPPKNQKIYHRSQIMKGIDDEEYTSNASSDEGSSHSRPDPRKGIVRGQSLYGNDSSNNDDLAAPPRTTFFESAGDLLNPPLPPREFLLDPAVRPRTIFHDRVYHPEDIPPPPTKRQRTPLRRLSSRDGPPSNNDRIPAPDDPNVSRHSNQDSDLPDHGGMKIEEKIARAYHKDLSWRKVLVRLEPDAHNNMIVRRMFANAYGWPVIKHLCDTHFAYTAAAEMADVYEDSKERAKPAGVQAGDEGEEVAGQLDLPPEDLGTDEPERVRSASHVPTTAHDTDLNNRLEKVKFQPPSSRTASESRESRDEVTALPSSPPTTFHGDESYSSRLSRQSKPSSSSSSQISRADSARWSDRFFEGDESDSHDDELFFQELQKARGRATVPVPADRKGLGPLVADKLTQSPERSGADLTTKEDSQSGAEVDRDVEPHPEHNDSRMDKPALSMTGVGLQRQPRDQLTPGSASGQQHNLTVAEQVAFAAAAQREGS